MLASLWLIWLILCLYDLRSILLILSAYMDLLRPTGVCSRVRVRVRVSLFRAYLRLI